MPNENYIWSLVSKKVANEISERELLELDKLLSKYPELHSDLENFLYWWNSSVLEINLMKSSSLFNRVKEKLKSERKA